MNFLEEMKQASSQYGLVLAERQFDLFDKYFELLVEWNKRMNLTAITDAREVAVKHMIDSLSCYEEPYFPAGCTVADVGSGAGFPGIPLKIFRPDIKLTLLDSLQKRLTFLETAVHELSLSDVQMVHIRAEEAGRQKIFRQKFTVVVSRAVARLNVLCEFCLPLVAVGCCFIALKGAQYAGEAEEAGRAVAVLGGKVARIKKVHLPGMEDVRAVIYIDKQAETPAGYPRRTGLPEKKPL
jgi:16S rRNA (guanine527-N7)-methyltransferase